MPSRGSCFCSPHITLGSGSYSHPVIRFLTVWIRAFNEQPALKIFECSGYIFRTCDGTRIDFGDDESFPDSRLGKLPLPQRNYLCTALDSQLCCNGRSKGARPALAVSSQMCVHLMFCLFSLRSPFGHPLT